MDVFKVRTGIAPSYKINKDNYERFSKRQEKYVNWQGAKEAYYGVCPACDNPIQLIGLYRKTDSSERKPYGRHNKGSIKGLASYSEVDYLNCPYSNPNQRHGKGGKRPESRLTRSILKTMVTQFDRVIYVLNKQTGLHITNGLAREMLLEYVNKEGWLFDMATLENVPWVLAESNRARPLFGRFLVKDSDLYDAIQDKCPEVLFEELDRNPRLVQVRNRNKEYINLQFVFLFHRQMLKGEHLNETIDFMVFRPRYSGEDEVIFQTTLPVDTEHFVNLISSPKNQDKRNQKLLTMAKSMVEPSQYE